MPTSNRASPARIDRHWRVLCDDIGCRYAGSPAEQQAADYIESQMRRFRLNNIHQHRFAFPNWDFSRCTLRVGRKRPTRRITTARPFVYSTSTPPGGVQGRLVYLQSGMPLDFDQPLSGRIGLTMGGLALGDESVAKRIVRSGLKALLAVDSRTASDWPTSNGAAPQWMKGYHVPMCGLSYMDAVKLVESLEIGPLQVHLAIQSRSFPARSQNVIGEIPGRDRPDQVIVVSGHHDSVWGIVGADDNGSGVIFVLELARLLARRRPRRTIRFISYGVEERLSVGSYLYMRSLKARERKQIVLALNADGGGSAVGTDVVMVTGTTRLEKLAKEIWDKRRHPAEIRRDLSPYSDQFPLNIAGVPSVWVTRPNIGSHGHWTLHSVHDNRDHVSPAVLARTIDTAAALLDRVADAPRLPLQRRIDTPLMCEVKKVARREYRHPWSPESFDYER